jgi:hypothetical protein
MSLENARKPIGGSEGASTHEPRASFRPSATPRRRALESGLDKSDLAERDEQARRSGSRRRERLFVEQGYE